MSAAVEIVPSACPHDCPSTCALEIERLDARTIGRVRGAADDPYTAGVVCAKVARYAERVHHPGRLVQPLRRTGAKGSGAFEPISWDDALDAVAEALVRAAQTHGSETVWPYFYAGTMGLVNINTINRLRHVMRYSGQHSTICTALVATGYVAGAGSRRGVAPLEMLKSDLIVIWGTNPVNTQINVMTHAMRARKERGARIAVVDPYRTGTAEQADIHLAVRPGTDGALACGIMHVLFKEGFADRDYMAKYTDAAVELETHLENRNPAWAAAITGLAEQEIVDFARLYGASKRSYIRLGSGFSRSRNGAANMHAALCLPAVTGAWQYEGGGALQSNSAIYDWDMGLLAGRDAIDPTVRVLDQSRIGPILTGDRRDLGDGPPVTAMLIQNTNPAVVAPESLKVRQGFLRDDLFTCVHEQFMTDTAKLADIVLPATTFVEHDDFYQRGGHSHILMGARAIEPLGECRSNHEVICALAKRLGAEHPGFAMTAWEIVDAVLKSSGLTDAASLKRDKWIDVQPGFDTAHFLDGFGHDDGKFHFSADWSVIGPDHAGMPRLPDHWAVIDEATETHPFRMVTAPARNYLNTTFTETPTSIKREGRPTVMIHPEAAGRLGIAEGDRVRIGNRRGSVVVHARLFDGLHPGVVVVESIWPNGAFEEGIGINALTGADAGKPDGGAVFHDTAVWIKAA